MVSDAEEAAFELAGSNFSFDIDSLVPWLDEAAHLWKDSHPDYLLATIKGSMILGASGFEAFVKSLVAIRDKEGKLAWGRINDYQKAKDKLLAAWELDLDKILLARQRADLRFLLCYRHVPVHLKDRPDDLFLGCVRLAYGEDAVREWNEGMDSETLRKGLTVQEGSRLLGVLKECGSAIIDALAIKMGYPPGTKVAFRTNWGPAGE